MKKAIGLFGLFGLAVIALGCPVPPITVTQYRVVTQRAATDANGAILPGISDFEVTATIHNHTPSDLLGIVGTVRSVNAQTLVLEKQLVVGHVVAHGDRQTADTFLVRAPTSLGPTAGIAVSWLGTGADAPLYREALIGLTGGTVAAGLGGATFESVIGSPAYGIIYVTEQPWDRDVFAETADIYRAAVPDHRQMRVLLGQAPGGDDVHVWLRPYNATDFVLWVRIPSTSPMGGVQDEYIPVPTTVRADGFLEGDIPPSAFRPGGIYGTWETVVMAAQPYNVWSRAPVTPVTHFCPLSTCEVASGFNLTRLNPVTGQVAPHLGVDYRTLNAAGTPVTGLDVYASAEGTVIAAYQSKTRAGRAVVIQHPDGSVSKYFHLQDWVVTPGTVVSPQQLIAHSGATGGVTGPHLHYELVEPDGGSGHHVDPVAVVVNTYPASITMQLKPCVGSSCGPLLSAQVWMDDTYLGTVVEGAWATFGMRLDAGQHQIVLNALWAGGQIREIIVQSWAYMVFDMADVHVLAPAAPPGWGTEVWPISVPQ